MPDLLSEGPISLDEARRLVPASRGAKRTNLSTLLRWILRGIQGPDGQRVRLEATRLGGRWLTSRQALRRFCERLTPALGDTERPRIRSLSTRQRASRRAARQLEKMGI